LLSDPADLELTTLRRMAPIAGQRVVEIGTGDGRLAWPLAPEAALWVAVEPDPTELSVAAGDFADSAPGPAVRLLRADGRALALADEAFDLALFTWSLC
jgi:ubiquinone/menaquinone biosynthesis C-methylase UbiE